MTNTKAPTFRIFYAAQKAHAQEAPKYQTFDRQISNSAASHSHCIPLYGRLSRIYMS